MHEEIEEDEDNKNVKVEEAQPIKETYVELEVADE